MQTARDEGPSGRSRELQIAAKAGYLALSSETNNDSSGLLLQEAGSWPETMVLRGETVEIQALEAPHLTVCHPPVERTGLTFLS